MSLVIRSINQLEIRVTLSMDRTQEFNGQPTEIAVVQGTAHLEIPSPEQRLEPLLSSLCIVALIARCPVHVQLAGISKIKLGEQAKRD